MTVNPLIPVAQYVRMSDEAQRYSVDNQKVAIREYASHHGFTIVKTYADLGKSGVVAKHRTALQELLKDVVSGDAGYKAVLVYDVSRWGRFPNNDEAAHYEFLCSSSGIPLHYCAEQFANDGTASSALLKALKRSMAAEFSRELGDKVFRGKAMLAQMGFWMGGPAGYGYRRRMVSEEGKLKEILRKGQQKSLKTDRITLVLGPHKELETVRMMFLMAAGGKNCTDIVRALNRKNILIDGKEWNDVTVLQILTNPKYTGSNVWNRHTQRLHTPLKLVEPQFWIGKPLSFPPIVGQRTFERAQATLQRMRDSRWPDEKILNRVRRLLKTKGRISESLILKARGMPSTATIHKHFGTFRQLYEKLGFDLDARHVFRSDQLLRSKRLRRALTDELETLFTDHVTATLSWKGARSTLRIDDTFTVAILFCGQIKGETGRCWAAKPAPFERDYITLLCLLNPTHDRVLHYYVASTMEQRKYQSLRRDSRFLRQATKLARLADFYATVKGVWEQRSISQRAVAC